MRIWKNLLNTSKRILQNWSYKKYLFLNNFYYTSIHELPIGIWFEALYEQKIINLAKPILLKRIFLQYHQYAFENCYDSYLKKFGLSDSFKNFLKNKKRKMQLQQQFLKTGEKRLLTEIEILSLGEEQQKTIQQQNLTKDLLIIGQFLNQRIHPLAFTVDEYYSTLLLIQENQKKNGKKN